MGEVIDIRVGRCSAPVREHGPRRAPVDPYDWLASRQADPDAQIEREVYAMIREYVWLVAGAGAALLWVLVFEIARHADQIAQVLS